MPAHSALVLADAIGLSVADGGHTATRCPAGIRVNDPARSMYGAPLSARRSG